LTSWSFKSLDIASTNSNALLIGYWDILSFLFKWEKISPTASPIFFKSNADSNSFIGKSFLLNLYNTLKSKLNFWTFSVASFSPVSERKETVTWYLLAYFRISRVKQTPWLCKLFSVFISTP
jgi:hypothetical protein